MTELNVFLRLETNRNIFVTNFMQKRKTISKNTKNTTSLQLASCEFYENSEYIFHRTPPPDCFWKDAQQKNNAETYSEPCQTSNMEHFAKITSFSC